MEQKDLKVTIEEARKWYTSGNPVLVSLALRAFSKKKLEEQEYPTDYSAALANVSEISTIEINSRKMTKHTLTNDDVLKTYLPKSDSEALIAFCKLLIYRDAWWKVDNYIPDFNFSDKKYCIFMSGNQVVLDETIHSSRVLAFQNKEIRDSFYKAFKNIIEEAKDLL